MQERLRVPVALVGSGLAGMLTAVQSRVNGGLGQQLENGYAAAAVSFSSGLVIIGVVALFSPRARRGVGLLRREVASKGFPWWGLTGGACGAFFVLAQGLVASVIGVALFTVGVVAGKVLGGLVMDRAGLGPGGRLDPSPLRIAGTALAIVAVVISVAGNPSGDGSPWLVAMPVLAGLGIAWQSAVNGLVRVAAQSAMTATLTNFFVGTVVLGLACAVSFAVRGLPDHWPTEPIYYFGGVAGVVFITLSSVLVRVAGVLLLSMSNVTGQLLASLLLEAGLPLAGGVTAGLVVGAAVALIAVVVAAIPSRRLAPRPTTAR
ncbi:MAG: DMT family transporter [Leucobacter sp.]